MKQCMQGIGAPTASGIAVEMLSKNVSDLRRVSILFTQGESQHPTNAFPFSDPDESRIRHVHGEVTILPAVQERDQRSGVNEDGPHALSSPREARAAASPCPLTVAVRRCWQCQ